MSSEEKAKLKAYMKLFRNKKPVIVEVGSWMGNSSVAISNGIRKYCRGALFHCVDIFSKEYYASVPGLAVGAKTDIRKIFEKNMKGYPHITMQMTSLEAAPKFEDESIDFIFIDANHDYEYVRDDINAWWPKLKTGGIMCGHDYSVDFKGVKKAVIERFPVHSNPVRTIWEVTK